MIPPYQADICSWESRGPAARWSCPALQTGHREDAVPPKFAQQGSGMFGLAPRSWSIKGSFCTLTAQPRLSRPEDGPPGHSAPGWTVGRQGEGQESHPTLRPVPSGCERSWTWSDQLLWLSSALAASQGCYRECHCHGNHESGQHLAEPGMPGALRASHLPSGATEASGKGGASTWHLLGAH